MENGSAGGSRGIGNDQIYQRAQHMVYANSRTPADSYKGHASLFAADKEISNSPVAIV